MVELLFGYLRVYLRCLYTLVSQHGTDCFDGYTVGEEHRRYIQLENGLYADVYSLEIIIPVAFRLNTYYTHVFRMWLVEKALSKEKRQAYVMFIQNGKTGYC